MAEQYGIVIVGQVDQAQVRKTISTTLAQVSKTKPSIDIDINVDKSVKDLKNIIAQANSVVQSFNSEGKLLKTTITGIDQETGKTVKVVQQFNAETGALANTFTTLSQSTGTVDNNFDKLSKRMTDLKNKGNSLVETMSHYASKEEMSRARALNSELQNMTDITKNGVGKADTLTKSLSNLSSEVKATGKNALNFSEAWKSAFRSFTLYSSVTVLWYAVIRAIKDGIDQVTEFDTAMTNLAKVTDATTSELDAFVVSAKNVAESIASTTIEAIDATTMFSRMGFTLKESLDLAKEALILKNVGDSIESASDSSSVLISILKGFNMEASESAHIVDSLNKISNEYAVTAGDLAEGIKRLASVASASGASYEQTLGLLTSMIEVSQNAEKSSTALRTLMLRIQGLSEEGEKLEDGFVAKFNEDFETIAGVSITVNGKLRNIYDIITDLGSRWGTLNQEEKIYLSTQAVGIRQTGEFMNLLNSYQTAIDATSDAINSENSALIENEKYMQSIEGRINLFNNALQNLWIKSINSNTIKSIVNLGTGLLTLAGNTGAVTDAITALTLALIAMRGVAITNWIFEVSAAFVGLNSAIILTEPQLALLVGGIWLAKKAYDAIVITTEEYNQLLIESENRINSLNSRKDELIKKSEDTNKAYQSEINNLNKLISLEQQRALQLAKDSAQKKFTDAMNESTAKAQDYVQKLSELKDIEEQLAVVGSKTDFYSKLITSDLLDRQATLVSQTDDYKIELISLAQELENQSYLLGDKLPESGNTWLTYLSNLIGYTRTYRDIAKETYDDILKEKLESKTPKTVSVGVSVVDTSSDSIASATKDILDNYKAQRQAISDISNEISILNYQLDMSEGEDRVNIQKQLITKYKEQQEALHAYSEEIRKTIAKGGLTDESLENLNNQLSDNGEEWWQLSATIYDVTHTMVSEVKSANQEIKDSYSDLLDDVTDIMKDQYKKQSDIKKEALQDEVDDIEEAMTELERAYRDATSDIKKEDIQEQISDLVAERAMRSVEGSLDANARIYEIDQELADLEKELDEQIREDEYNSAKDVLEDKKTALQKEIDAEKDALDKRLDAIEDFTKYKNELEENSMYELVDMLAEFDDAFAQDAENKGEAWVSVWQDKIQEMLDLMEQVTGEEMTVSTSTTSSSGSSSSSSGTITSSGISYLSSLSSTDKTTQATIDYLNSSSTSAADKQKAAEWLSKYGTGYETHHDGLSGGIVGGGDILKKNEVFAKLLDREWVLNQRDLDIGTSNLKSLLSNQNISNSNANTSTNIGDINVVFNGTITNSSDSVKYGKQVAETIKSELLSSGKRI